MMEHIRSRVLVNLPCGTREELKRAFDQIKELASKAQGQRNRRTERLMGRDRVNSVFGGGVVFSETKENKDILSASMFFSFLRIHMRGMMDMVIVP